MAQRVASGCLVFHDGNCLLLRRSALEDTMQGLWEMPAGKIESDLDGSPEENAIRETLEEAGIALGNVVPLGEHLTETKRFYGFLGVSDTANVELSFEHDAFVWMSVPDILAAVAANDMMVGHHTVYFLQQLLDDAEGLIYEAEYFYLPNGTKVRLLNTDDVELINDDFIPFDLEGVDFIPWSEELFSMPLNCGICNRPNQHYQYNDNVCIPCSTEWIYIEEGIEGEGYYRLRSLEAETFAAESGDVRINYNANCPACISIMSLIGEEKRETDPAGTYWGEGAYQNEVQHLQDGDWDFGDGQGRVQLHEPLLVGGIHHNLLGRAGSLLHEYNNNGNGNILEMGEDEECYQCGGTGEYECWSDCDDGKQECYTCDGTGDVEDDEGEEEVCDDCDGSGEEDCSSCDGQTYCEECGGSGEFWNEEIVRGIDNWYQTNVIDYIYAHGDSDIRYALDRLVEGLESGQLRTTYGQEMYSDANHKLYNDLHDAIVYYVINTPNKPLPEGDTLDAETFAADSCIECGRKEGPYADTVLIACPGCPELTCQHCYDEEKQGCLFCIRKRAETFSAEKITKEELVEYLDWLENGFGFFFDNSPQAQRFYDLLAGDLQINSADVDFTNEDEFILLGAEEIPMGLVVKSFKTTSKIYYNRKIVRHFYGPRHREQADSIAGHYARKLQKNPNYFSYLRFGAEEYIEDTTEDTDAAIAQIVFALVTLRDLLMQNMTDEALEFINGEYLPERIVDEIIDDDLRAEVQAFIDSKSPERFESESLTGKDMSYCKCGTKDEVGGFTCGQHCSRIEKNGETFEARFIRSLNTPRQPMPWDLEPNMAEEGMPYLTRREYDTLIRMGYTEEEIRKGYQRSYEAESTSKPARVEIKRATIDPYKLTAVFYDKDDKKIKTTHFGDERYEDYTIHKDKERLKNYNTRHGAKSAGEKWQKPMTAGALSKWILWNKPSLKASFDDYKRRFKLKGDLKAKTSGGRKRAETFATEYTPSQTLGDYDARELALSSVATGDFFTDSLKFSTTRKASEEYNEDNQKMQEAAEKIIEILGEPDNSFQREGGFYASLGEPYTPDMVYVLEYEVLTDEGPKDTWNFGLQMARKLRQQGTEPWSDDRWTGGSPTYAAGAFHLERETFIVTVLEGNPAVESVVMDLHQYFADKYGVNGTGFEPAYTVALDEAGNAVTADDIEIDTTWRDSMRGFESEEEDAKKLREYEKTYGKKQAKIRMRLKKKIYKEESMGTKAGQWSARKSQKLKREYEKACERAGLKPYKTGKTEKQEDLEDWTDQKWKTSSGKKSSKTGEPYFPAKAVEALKKKGLYAKAKRQKAKATKAGKQNARYSDDIRKVVAKYRAESFQADTDVVLYFGTSTRFLTDIERFGLSDPMLTLDLAVADDYAMATAEQYGGNAIVVEVSAFADLLDRVDWQGNIFEYYGDIPPAALYVMDWDDRTGSWS